MEAQYSMCSWIGMIWSPRSFRVYRYMYGRDQKKFNSSFNVAKNTQEDPIAKENEKNWPKQ